MRIGIGLPTLFPAGETGTLLEWARRADAAGFSSLTMLDRLVYGNVEPLVGLAAAAAVTSNIQLVTAVLLAPLREPGILAKQAASIDALSGGRLTLGIGIGSRADDYAAAPAEYGDRGKRFERDIVRMKRIWAGEPAGEGVGPIGPAPARPGGPELLIGGRADVALKRSGRLGDGYITGSVSDIEGAVASYAVVKEAWDAASKSGAPRFVGSLSCAIGEDAAERTMEETLRYYAYQSGPPGNRPGGPGASSAAAKRTLPATAEAIREVLLRCEQAGMDEVILRPGVPDPNQVDMLAKAVL